MAVALAETQAEAPEADSSEVNRGPASVPEKELSSIRRNEVRGCLDLLGQPLVLELLAGQRGAEQRPLDAVGGRLAQRDRALVQGRDAPGVRVRHVAESRTVQGWGMRCRWSVASLDLVAGG